MEKLETILSLSATVIVFLSSIIGLTIKLAKAIKERNIAKVQNILYNAAQDAVVYAETIKGVSGAEKKNIALRIINEKMLAKRTNYDEEKAAEAIESIITISKEVNAK